MLSDTGKTLERMIQRRKQSIALNQDAELWFNCLKNEIELKLLEDIWYWLMKDGILTEDKKDK